MCEIEKTKDGDNCSKCNYVLKSHRLTNETTRSGKVSTNVKLQCTRRFNKHSQAYTIVTNKNVCDDYAYFAR